MKSSPVLSCFIRLSSLVLLLTPTFSLIGGDMKSISAQPVFKSNYLHTYQMKTDLQKDNFKTTSKEQPLGLHKSYRNPFLISYLDKSHTGTILSAAGAEPPYGFRAWDGNNPFHQPAITTDYYGSGDADNDGDVDLDDVLLVQDMVNGIVTNNARADVDGDGNVDSMDVSLIEDTLTGGILPAWWNQLTTRTEREHWVDHVLALDQTDTHPYDANWWVCFNYAVQLFTHGAFYRGDLSRTNYDGGQTIYNIPLYTVGVYGHAINGILVGDDPLDFDDWRFIEPQTDADVEPGMWDMPYGSVRIDIPEEIYTTGHTAVMKVKFTVSSTGWILDAYDPTLVLERPTFSPQIPDNRPDLWNPKVIPGEMETILFERFRDDVTRTVDIHMGDLPIVDPSVSEALNLSTHRSHLLDIIQDSSGTTHLLWKGKDNYIPGVFYGQLNPDTGEITGKTRVSSGVRIPLLGRLVVLPGGEIHIFWLEGRSNSNHPSLPGVYWTWWNGSTWQPEENLTPDNYEYLYDNMGWYEHSAMGYYFDVAASGDDIYLIWVERRESVPVNTFLRYRVYTGSWSVPITIETSPIQGVDLVNDSTGLLHTVYWSGSSSVYTEGRGNLMHRIFNESDWSPSEIVDTSGQAGYPRMAAGDDGEITIVWERLVAGQVVPVWSQYHGNSWSSAQVLSIQTGTDAWYPDVEILPGSSMLFTWSSRSVDLVTIESANIKPVTADFTAHPRTGIAPLVVTFTNTSQGDYSDTWWDLGDGWVSAMQHTAHQYSVGGIYTVTLTVSGLGGNDSITKTNYITIYNPVQANFTAVPTSGIAPLAVQFTNTSSGDFSQLLWDFGDGTSSDENSPIKQYNQTGSYTVTLLVTGLGGSDSETKPAFISVLNGIYLPFILNL